MQSFRCNRMYELTFILSPILDEAGLTSAMKEVKDKIVELEGEIKKEKMSEKKKLAYPVKKQIFGFYSTIEFSAEPEKIGDLRNFIKGNPSILRSIIITFEEKKREEAPRQKKIKEELPSAFKSAEFKPEKEKIKIEELNKKLEEILEE